MEIMTFLDEDAVTLDLEARDKDGVLKELIDLLMKSGKINDKKRLVQVLRSREELGSTGIGQGVAIPHGKSDQVKSICASFGLSKEGIPFDALDGEPVHLFFLLVAPEGEAAAHLKALARISSLVKDKYFRKTLQACKTTEDVVSLIRREEKARY